MRRGTTTVRAWRRVEAWLALLGAAALAASGCEAIAGIDGTYTFSGSGGGGGTASNNHASSGSGSPCKTPVDCADTGTACIRSSCDGTGHCVTVNAELNASCSDHGGIVCASDGRCVACNAPTDCDPGTVCVNVDSCTSHGCVVSDAAKGTACSDHGGTQCDGNGVCKGVCNDGQRDGDETDVDCGGSCTGCDATKGCLGNSDCISGTCFSNTCVSAVSVASGRASTCAVTNAGGVKCWGGNLDGQLGDGTTSTRTTPVDVAGLTSGVVAVAAGYHHACAVTVAGGLKCWGLNTYGQLGDGTTTTRLTPIDVVGLTSGVAAVTTGHFRTCALTTSKGIKCWGDNTFGQIGDGTTTVRLTPVDVSGLASGVADVSAGYQHVCAVKSTGAVLCWGNNADGQLGDGTSTQRSLPTTIPALTGVVVSAGYNHTCATNSSGKINCWGANTYGELGDGTTVGSLVPVGVKLGTTAAKDVSAGDFFTCELTTTNGVKCWGQNSNGKLGNGTDVEANTPTDALDLAGVTSLSPGGYREHSCAIAGGRVACWGDNGNGQIGNGTIGAPTYSTPTPVTGL